MKKSEKNQKEVLWEKAHDCIHILFDQEIISQKEYDIIRKRMINVYCKKEEDICE